ncbi:hypothetical protein ACS0PU_009380 [Formica fusca]
MNSLIITLCVLMEVAVIIAQKNNYLSSCQILDKYGKDYFCNYYCHPISVSSGNVQKTQTESYNGINKVEITTISSLQRYPTISKSSRTRYNINKEAARHYAPFTSTTPSRPSVLSTAQEDCYLHHTDTEQKTLEA